MERTTIVTLTDGRYQGKFEENGVLSFKNIPYATAKRWQKAKPVAPHEGITDAFAFGPAPYQNPPDPEVAKKRGDLLEVWMEEDCLNANVWTWDVETPKKAVLFWVYGGSYIQGYNYKYINIPLNFIKNHPEIVMVSCNYRVGIFGSLNLSSLTKESEYAYSNNLALCDLLQALHWVKENIEAFGGDPENITLYGHSAGSNASSQLLCMRSAKGLFQKAICQSSFKPDLGTVAYDTSEQVAEKFFELAGVSSLEDALNLSPEQILAAQKGLFRFRYHGSRESKMFSPVMDNLVVFEDDLMRFCKGEINAKAIIFGSSQGEYDQMFRAMDAEETKKSVMERDAGKHVTAEDLAQFRSMHPEMTEKEAYMSVHNELGLVLAGEMLARTAAKYRPVWQYVFRLREDDGMRAAHGAPMCYVFGRMMAKRAPEKLVKEMMDTWAAFINTGNPNNPSIPEWKNYCADGAVMCIDENWILEDQYWKKDFEMWKERFPEYRFL